MAVPGGLGTAWGFAKETTYATPVTPTRYLEITSEGLDFNKTAVQGRGLRGGSTIPGGTFVPRHARRKIVQKAGGGPVAFEIPTKGLGLLLQAMLGSTATAVQIASTTAYKQVHTMGDSLPSYTLQKLISRFSGTQDAFTYPGAKVESWEISCAAGQIATLGTTWTASDCRTDISAGTPAYATSGSSFTFLGGNLTLGGTVTTTSSVASVSGGTVIGGVTAASVGVNNSIRTGVSYFNSGGTQAEPIRNDYVTPTGSLTVDYQNPTDVFAAFQADTSLALHLWFQGDLIAGSNYELLDILVPSIKFNGEAPKAGGPDIITITAPFEGGFDDVNTPIQVTYVSTDTAL